MPKKLLPLEYPLHDSWRVVRDKGSVSISTKHSFFLSDALAFERVGLREIDTGKWLVSFMHLNLGQYDEQKRRFTRAKVIL